MKRLISTILLLILVLGWATPVFAQGGPEQPGQVIFGSDRYLEVGDVINGDLVIFGGSLRMADGSRIEGDAVIFGGRAEIDGEIEGALAVIGGNAELGRTAQIEGDVASIGGEVDMDEGAYVGGEIVETTQFDFGQLPLPSTIRAIPPQTRFDVGFDYEPANQFFRIVLGFGRGLVAALVLAAIGLLVVLFLPDQTGTVRRAVTKAAPTSFGVGLLTLFVGILAVTLLFITCCLIPVGLLLALALVLATLYGWIVVGYLLGQRMLRAIQHNNEEPTAASSALVGIFVVTLVQQGLMALSHTPCLGFFFWILGVGLWLIIAATGLGAVVLTRFGTQPYMPSTPSTTPPTALPPSAAEEAAQLETPDEAGPEALDEPADTQSEPENEVTDSPDSEGPSSENAPSNPDDETTDAPNEP